MLHGSQPDLREVLNFLLLSSLSLVSRELFRELARSYPNNNDKFKRIFRSIE